MKKTFFVLASAALLVFAFTAVAGAKYAGYFLDGSKASPTAAASTTPGYLSWGGATTLMANNGIASDNALSNTAHGGYITTTTKCAVCHSAHRATGGSAVGTINNQFLTAGGGSCVQCHTAWGSTQASLLVEWANPEDASNKTAGGPHSSNSCATCHKGGIHGGSSSQYWGMNAYMLGGGNDAQIKAELPYQNRTLNGGAALVTSLDQTYTDGTGTGTDWFVNGSTSPAIIGGIPGQSDPHQTASMTTAQFAAAKSLLTGYTCSQTGCHVNSVFANITWGQTYSRQQLGAGNGYFMTTGHSSAPGANMNMDAVSEESWMANNGEDVATGSANGCGPCHAGNAAGGYRMVSYQYSARAYGCDQCHDAVGVATNSTAFPHGNRNIYIYQWTNGTSGNSSYQAPTSIKASSGNIWMYRSNMASTDGSMATLVDPSITLMQGTVGSAAPGNITDGVCLKCHVPADAQSAAAYSMSGTFKIGAGHHGATPGSDPAGLVGADLSTINPYSGALGSGQTSGSNGSNLLFLWR